MFCHATYTVGQNQDQYVPSPPPTPPLDHHHQKKNIIYTVGVVVITNLFVTETLQKNQ